MISTESEFLQYAFSKYDNPHLISITEFEQDLNRFKYLNKLLNRYRDDRTDLKDRLILNHIVILGNCFTIAGLMDMLQFKITPNNIKTLCTFLYYLRFIAYDQEKIDFYLLDILNEY